LNPILDDYNIKDLQKVLVIKSLDEDHESDPNLLNSMIKKAKNKQPKILKIKNLHALNHIYPHTRLDVGNFDLCCVPNVRFKKWKEMNNEHLTKGKCYGYIDFSFDKLAQAIIKYAQTDF